MKVLHRLLPEEFETCSVSSQSTEQPTVVLMVRIGVGLVGSLMEKMSSPQPVQRYDSGPPLEAVEPVPSS